MRKDMEIRAKYCSFVKKIKSKRDYYILDSYKLPLNHFEYPVFFHKLGLKELPQHVLARIKGKDIIDGGAYIGDSALILEELSPRTIYAFEALKENFDMLNKTIQLNGLRNVVPLKKGLGKKEGNMKIIPFGSASFLAEIFGEDAGESVEMISVDDFVNETGAHVGLIKLDVEGSELDVLTGAKETIKEYKPVLVVSVYHRGQDFFEIPKLIKELNPSYQMRFLNLNRVSATFERVILAFTND
jgi:FkbM family methyltransferase